MLNLMINEMRHRENRTFTSMAVQIGFICALGLVGVSFAQPSLASSNKGKLPNSKTMEHKMKEAAKKGIKVGDVTVLTFTNKDVGGKKTWLPAEVAVPANSSVKINLINTLDAPHGFEVMGLSDAVVVDAKKTKTITFKTKKKGTHKIRCQMHPAHVGATLQVN